MLGWVSAFTTSLQGHPFLGMVKRLWVGPRHPGAEKESSTCSLTENSSNNGEEGGGGSLKGTKTRKKKEETERRERTSQARREGGKREEREKRKLRVRKPNPTKQEGGTGYPPVTLITVVCLTDEQCKQDERGRRVAETRGEKLPELGENKQTNKRTNNKCGLDEEGAKKKAWKPGRSF